MDESTIRYASVICQIMEADVVYFLHVARDLNLPEEVASKYRDVLAPVDETIKHQVNDTVAKFFKQDNGTESHTDILEDKKPTEAIIKYAKRKDVDLIIMGKHGDRPKKPTVNAGKIAELSHCSLLLVPKGAEIRFKSLVVAVDFSDHSRLALEQAMKIKEQDDSVHLYGLHVYRVPSGYHKTGKGYDEFARIMEGHARRDADKFFKKHDELDAGKCDMRYLLNNDSHVEDELNDFATAHEANMIMIGSQGRTPAAAFLLGSVAEQILNYKNNIPVFIVKEKNSNMNFLQALFKI